MAAVLELNGHNFAGEVLESDLPVLVDFWASWCGPCRFMAPVIDQIAEEYAGRVKVAKVNVDDNMDLARTYEVASIPTLAIFQNGQLVERLIGLRPKEEVVAALERFI